MAWTSQNPALPSGRREATNTAALGSPTQIFADRVRTTRRVALKTFVNIFTLHSWALKVGLSIAGLEASFTGAVIAVRGVSAGGISWTRGSVFTLVHTIETLSQHGDCGHPPSIYTTAACEEREEETQTVKLLVLNQQH